MDPLPHSPLPDLRPFSPLLNLAQINKKSAIPARNHEIPALYENVSAF